MRLRILAVITSLALSLFMCAQQNPVASDGTAATDKAATPETKSCCHHAADAKDAAACCHHAQSDAKDTAACCGANQKKCEMKDADCCARAKGKDAKACCGTDARACMKQGKNGGACGEGKCCGEGKSAKNCGDKGRCGKSALS